MNAKSSVWSSTMGKTPHLLTALSLALALLALGLEATAATCLGALPPASVVPGWSVMADSTRSGRMGSNTSYDVYDGAVEELQDQGIVAFAQRMYRGGSSGQFVTVDLYELETRTAAGKLYAQKLKDSRNAKPLNSYAGIKDKAFVGTLGAITLGVCTRGKFLCEVVMTKAPGARDRTTVRKFVTVTSGRLAP